MPLPRFVEIDGRRFLWRDLVALRQARRCPRPSDLPSSNYVKITAPPANEAPRSATASPACSPCLRGTGPGIVRGRGFRPLLRFTLDDYHFASGPYHLRGFAHPLSGPAAPLCASPCTRNVRLMSMWLSIGLMASPRGFATHAVATTRSNLRSRLAELLNPSSR